MQGITDLKLFLAFLATAIIFLLSASCSTKPSINGYCEYLPIRNYVKSDLEEQQKNNIRKNNYVYDVKCLGFDYSK